LFGEIHREGLHPIIACQPDAILANAMVDDQEIYALIGEEGFRRLVGAFYRQVPGDDILGPMYPPHDLAGAEERLREFLAFRFGGPPRYLEQRGHPRLRMRHAPFPIGQAARDRWMQLMKTALAEAALPADAEAVLREFFESTATFMMNRPG
jgi:hemoglobin